MRFINTLRIFFKVEDSEGTIYDIWTVQGEQGAAWIQANIDLPPASSQREMLAMGKYQLIFTAKINGVPGIYAIDDFSLVEGTCSQVCQETEKLSFKEMHSFEGTHTWNIDALFIRK